MRIAVVSGASSGMGKEFVKLLDNNGLDQIWCLGINFEDNNAYQATLKTKVRIFDMDLTKQENLDKLNAELQKAKPQIEWVVNASGYGKFGRYDQINMSDTLGMIDLNCRALVAVTQYCLPYVVDKGRIVQIASVAAFQPVPYINVYAATKAFVLSYSRALGAELKNRGISVTSVCPFWTKTAFFKRAKATEHDVVTKYIAMYEPQDVINKAFRDATKRKKLSIYGFKARAQVRLACMTPKNMVMKVWIKQQKLDKKYKD